MQRFTKTQWLFTVLRLAGHPVLGPSYFSHPRWESPDCKTGRTLSWFEVPERSPEQGERSQFSPLHPAQGPGVGDHLPKHTVHRLLYGWEDFCSSEMWPWFWAALQDGPLQHCLRNECHLSWVLTEGLREVVKCLLLVQGTLLLRHLRPTVHPRFVQQDGEKLQS